MPPSASADAAAAPPDAVLVRDVDDDPALLSGEASRTDVPADHPGALADSGGHDRPSDASACARDDRTLACKAPSRFSFFSSGVRGLPTQPTERRSPPAAPARSRRRSTPPAECRPPGSSGCRSPRSAALAAAAGWWRCAGICCRRSSPTPRCRSAHGEAAADPSVQRERLVPRERRRREESSVRSDRGERPGHGHVRIDRADLIVREPAIGAVGHVRRQPPDPGCRAHRGRARPRRHRSGLPPGARAVARRRPMYGHASGESPGAPPDIPLR